MSLHQLRNYISYSFKIIKNVGTTVKTPIDIFSIILSILGFGGLLYGVSSISSDGWDDPLVLITIIGDTISWTIYLASRET